MFTLKGLRSRPYGSNGSPAYGSARKLTSRPSTEARALVASSRGPRCAAMRTSASRASSTFEGSSRAEARVNSLVSDSGVARSRNTEVAQQRLASMKALVHGLDAFESFDRGTEVGHRLDSLLGRKLKLEQPAESAVLDEGGVGERRKRQACRTLEKAVPGGHGGMQAVELRLGQEFEIVRQDRLFRGSRFAPWQRPAGGVASREHVHQAAHYPSKWAAVLVGMRAQAAEGHRLDATEPRCERGLKCCRVFGPAQGFQVTAQETHH